MVGTVKNPFKPDFLQRVVEVGWPSGLYVTMESLNVTASALGPGASCFAGGSSISADSRPVLSSALVGSITATAPGPQNINDSSQFSDPPGLLVPDPNNVTDLVLRMMGRRGDTPNLRYGLYVQNSTNRFEDFDQAGASNSAFVYMNLGYLRPSNTRAIRGVIQFDVALGVSEVLGGIGTSSSNFNVNLWEMNLRTEEPTHLDSDALTSAGGTYQFHVNVIEKTLRLFS